MHIRVSTRHLHLTCWTALMLHRTVCGITNIMQVIREAALALTDITSVDRNGWWVEISYLSYQL